MNGAIAMVETDEKPVITWKGIHRAFFVDHEGRQIISERTLRSYAAALFESGVVLKKPIGRSRNHRVFTYPRLMLGWIKDTFFGGRA